MPTPSPNQTFRFGAFELNSRSGELRKRGIRIKLQDQPVQVLTLLLERAGEIVSREDIRHRMWPEDTFVDFDNAISSAVRKLREALSDSPDNPRFIETVARQGYRFIGALDKNDESLSPTLTSIVEQIPPNGVPLSAVPSKLGIPISGLAGGTSTNKDKAADGIGKNEVTAELKHSGARTGKHLGSTAHGGIGWAVRTIIMMAAVLGAWWAGRREGLSRGENPLSSATFARLIDLPGDKTDAAISPDGKFVAFRADSGGRSDVWVSQVETGRPINLTKDQSEDPLLPIPNLGFSGDGSEIWLAGYRGYRPERRVRLIPLMGGSPRVFLRDHAANVAWSADGEHLVFHTYDPGDPVFVADGDGANAREIFRLGPGFHNHFPTWSPDGRWIYFVSGPWESLDMDLWRIAPTGGKPERLTHHNADVRSVAPLSEDTVLYIAPQQDGSGPWLWALDVERRISRRVSIGLEHYTSVAASTKSHRVVATVANPTASLWTVPILERVATEADIKPFLLPNERALAPRFAGDCLFYLSSRGTGDGLWRFQNGQALEIWKGAEGPLLVPAAISPDARSAAIVLRKNGKLRLHLVSADGAEFQQLTDAIDVRGAPGWSPDGKWIVTGGDGASGPGLFKIRVEGGAPVRLPAKPGLNPVWSPDGSLIVYAGTTMSRFAPLLAIRADGRPFELPPIGVGAGRGINRAHHRFTPDGKGLIYLRGMDPGEDFWHLDLKTGKTRLLARLGHGTSVSFDITPDGKEIVLDRVRENSDVVLIDFPK